MQDRGGLIKNTVQKAGITDALSMEYLMHDNPFNLWYARQREIGRSPTGYKPVISRL